MSLTAGVLLELNTNERPVMQGREGVQQTIVFCAICLNKIGQPVRALPKTNCLL